jgi:hypothetical protein
MALQHPVRRQSISGEGKLTEPPVKETEFDLEKVKSVAEALTTFKDWSNYLLITTVAAVGWVGGKDSPKGWLSVISIWLLCFSVISGIFTLALIPIIREQIPNHVKKRGACASFYDIKPPFRFLPFSRGEPHSPIYIKYVCWFQHVFFILGVISYIPLLVDFANPVIRV